MTFEPEEGDFSQVCPYLGLADDADSHATYPTEAHRCYRLPNPTRIATGHQETYCLGEAHVSCPVYQGEGVSRPVPPPAAAAPPQREPAMAGATAAPAPPRGGGAGRPARGAQPREQGQPGRAQRPQQQRRTAPGTLGPRPRAGGISMPVATVGLFAGAIVIALLAAAVGGGWFGGGGDDDNDVPTLPTKTTTAVQTQQGGNGTTTPAPGTQTQQTGSATPGTSTATRTATGTTTASAGEYTVKSGDTCSEIATANNITLDALLKANNMTEADCEKLQVGQKLKLK